jgi:ubiquinone/menaquinone biosynthesis C-methylase UbiE
MECWECIQNVVRRHGLAFNRFGKVLDFGCGCGRIMRQWQDLTGSKRYGVDSNPRLVEWWRRSLTFGQFEVNISAAPLDFADSTFDFIYSISVFTHLSETNQHFWMGELIRVLKPG